MGHRAARHGGWADGARCVAAAGAAGRAGEGSHGTGAAGGAGLQDRGTGGAIKDPQDIRGNMKSITKKDNYEDSWWNYYEDNY